MKATGIVRRIDDLGRVVIPKEIRRNLRIREGDPLEIYVDEEGEVILKKYSSIAELGVFAQEYADSLHQATLHTTFITDRDTVVAVSGKGVSHRDYLERPVSSVVEKAMESRKSAILSRAGTGEAGNPCSVIEDDMNSYTMQVLAPIVAGGDPIGCVTMVSSESDAHMGDMELKLAETAAGFLSRQMEQ